MDLICGICFEALPSYATRLAITEKPRTIASCQNGHDEYHEVCLRKWRFDFQTNPPNQKSCPECRAPIEDIKIGEDVIIGDNFSIIGTAIIGNGSRIKDDVFIQGPVIIEENVIIGNHVRIQNHGPRMIIGRGTSLGDHVQIYGSIHPITIGEECLIGDNVIIDGCMTIGNRVIIGNASSLRSSWVQICSNRTGIRRGGGTNIEEEVSIGDRVVIFGPATIKRNASIGNDVNILQSYIGAGATIENKTRITGSDAVEQGNTINRFGVEACKRFLRKIQNNSWSSLDRVAEDWTELSNPLP